MPVVRRTLLTGLAVILLLMAGLIPSLGATVRADAATTVPRPDHIVVVLLENEDAGSIMGSSEAPYLNDLAAQGASMTQSYAVTHPSQPNYLALFSGSTQGVTNDDCPKNFPGRPNLGSQLLAAGVSFTGYSETLPTAGYTGCEVNKPGGNYRRKHNPWVDFTSLPASTNQPFSAFTHDYAKLPRVSFVVPNMCHDMHDCSVGTGDTWVKQNLDGYAQWAKTHNSLLVVTFDEAGGNDSNQIATLIVGGPVRPGPSAERMTHYTLLRTLEAAYGVPGLGNAAKVPPLTSIWKPAPQPTGVVNGSFEHGLTGWSTSGTVSNSPTSRHGGSLNAGARSRNGDSILRQTIVVPAGKTTLSMYWLGLCHDSVSHAWATIVVAHNTSGKTSTPLPRSCVPSGPWKKVTQKVTPGHSYTISLISHDDGQRSTPNNTYFDDVSLS